MLGYTHLPDVKYEDLLIRTFESILRILKGMFTLLYFDREAKPIGTLAQVYRFSKGGKGA